MECKNCNTMCVKRGFNRSVQRWFCKSCQLYQQNTYVYRICTIQDKETIIKLNNIGVGISGISNFTGISKSNVIHKIKQISKAITKPDVKEDQQTYEVDEMHTFVKNKSHYCYITYALNRETKKVVDLIIGSRTKETLEK